MADFVPKFLPQPGRLNPSQTPISPDMKQYIPSTNPGGFTTPSKSGFKLSLRSKRSGSNGGKKPTPCVEYFLTGARSLDGLHDLTAYFSYPFKEPESAFPNIKRSVAKVTFARGYYAEDFSQVIDGFLEIYFSLGANRTVSGLYDPTGNGSVITGTFINHIPGEVWIPGVNQLVGSHVKEPLTPASLAFIKSDHFSTEGLYNVNINVDTENIFIKSFAIILCTS